MVFKFFIVMAFKDKFKNGKTISYTPSYNEVNNLVLAKAPKVVGDYKAAEGLAQGWSKLNGSGPAFIYLAAKENDENAVFLCEYFKGKLANDQVEKYFKIVKKDLDGRLQIEKNGGWDDQEEAQTTTAPSAATANVTQQPSNTSTSNGSVILGADGQPLNSSYIKQTNFSTIIEDLEEINETSLEKLISDSLVEAYSNVAGYRLTECTYLNESLNVSGTIYFASGNTRKATYTFTEAFIENDKINLKGLNEKLGTDKQFTLSGKIENKTFITESFKCNK